MKISKKILLLFLLCGIFGNTFAKPIVISCSIFSDKLDKKTYKIEFDDDYRNRIFVNGQELDRAKFLKDFSDSNIVFYIQKEIIRNQQMDIHFYRFNIDREDGSVKFIYENPQGLEDKSEGRCIKAKDVVNKF